MFRSIFAALKYYNANTSDSRVGDCVVRGISLALSQSYDTTRAELNKLKRELGSPVYNIPRVYGRYLRERGITSVPYSARETAQQFCESHPTGTYLLETDSRKAALNPSTQLASDHVCCVIDGDLYDSWDSRNSVVCKVFPVTATPVINDIDVRVIWEPVAPEIVNYLAILQKKYPQYIASLEIPWAREKDPYTVKFCVRLMFNIDNEEMPAYIRRFQHSTDHMFVLKISPTTTEADVPKYIKSMRQKIYDWWYLIKQDLDDKIGSTKIAVHPKYYGDRAKLMRLPEWCRALIHYYRDDGNTNYEDKFLIYMDALPDDPRAELADEVTFRADTLSEIKQQLEDYRTRYIRVDYDY